MNKIVAFTSIGPSSDILIRESINESGKSYDVEVRKEKSLQHITPFKDYDSAEKFYDDLLEKCGVEVFYNVGFNNAN